MCVLLNKNKPTVLRKRNRNFIMTPTVYPVNHAIIRGAGSLQALVKGTACLVNYTTMIQTHYIDNTHTHTHTHTPSRQIADSSYPFHTPWLFHGSDTSRMDPICTLTLPHKRQLHKRRYKTLYNTCTCITVHTCSYM